MYRFCYSVFIVLGFFKLSVRSQYVESPCPDIFEYKNDGDGIYGLIHLRQTGPISTVMLRTNFTIAARLPTGYIGRLEPINNGILLQQYTGAPIKYRVHFPVTSPLPRLTSLVVNENVLCYGPGDIPGPNRYVTTISLQHMLFLRPGHSGAGLFTDDRAPTKPDSVYEYIGSLPNDDRVYNINDDGNRQGSWNTNYYPFVINNSRPDYEPLRPTITITNNRIPPEPPAYYPEQTTQTPPRRPVEPIPPPRVPPTVVTTSECGIVAGGNERVPLIYNGQSYSRGDWPWLVAIYKRKDGSLTFICSGTLVSDRHVVSAAHCMQQKNAYTSIKDIVVKVGVYNLEDWGDDITVTRTLSSAAIHESYNASTLANDILVFTFERTVEFNINIRPACLWNGNSDLTRIVGASGVVAGWGRSEFGPAGHGEPRMVRIPVVSTATCRASKPDFHQLTSDKTLCAGDRNGVGPCLGDSGGGLYILDNGRWRIRGVVSLSLRPENGDNTCNLNEYIIFTDAAKYLPWIKSIMAS